MKTYIERAAVKDEILSWAVCINHPELLSKEDTMYCIDNISAADVVEVRHGRWIHPVPGDGENHCSVCHAEQPWFYGYGYYEPDYCPNCGALMKEDEHEAD